MGQGSDRADGYIQPPGSYRFAEDALLLRDRCLEEIAPNSPAVLLDAGAGCGVIGLEILARCPRACCVAVEREPALAAAAEENAVRFGLESRFTVICADICDGGTAKRAREAGLYYAGQLGLTCQDAGRPFAVAVCNPPWHVTGTGREPASYLRRRALFGGPEALPSFLGFAGKCLGRNGVLVTVGGAGRLSDYLKALPVGTIKLRPVYPSQHSNAALFLLTVRRGAKTGLTIEEPLWSVQQPYI